MGRVMLPLYTPRYVPNGSELACITTNKGTIIVELDGKNAPVAVGNFIELAHQGFYEKTKFHAYKAHSVIAGGCPVTRGLGAAQVDAGSRGVLRGIHPGTGDARYTIKDEYVKKPNNKHKLGSLCLAHKSEPNSSSCQFYFSLARQAKFDKKFTVFGATIKGLDVLAELRIGDEILSIDILGADQMLLAEALLGDISVPFVATSA